MKSDLLYTDLDRVFFSDNERSYVIQVISEINAYLRGKGISIKRAGGERTINGGTFVKFPDVLLFSDIEQSMILQGWEAKCPDVPIDDPGFVKDAEAKARLLKCNSFVLWNFQYAQLHICDTEGNFSIAKHWIIDSRIGDRQAIDEYRQEWIRFLHSLIDTINEFIVTGRIRHRSLGDALTDSVMPALINQNKSILASHLRSQAAKNVLISTHIESWWATIKNEYSHDERDPFSAYAKNVLVNWLNKFMFANMLQTEYDAARAVGSITEGCKIQEALDYFRYITECCDFYNVFAHLAYSEILPDATWEDLVAFNSLLQECDLRHLAPEYAHRILEESISVAKRQIAGQYPTPEPLALLMSEIAVRNAYENAWDCCCGTGTIGCAIWKRKVQMLDGVVENPEELAFQTTWMSDIHDFPLQIATQRLASLSPSQSPLLVFRRNVFEMRPGEELKVVSPENGAASSVALPEFDAIVSNLPFVDFNTSEISWYDSVKETIKNDLQLNHGISLSDRNDLYCYITLHLLENLKDSGVACLLTSNSWLCTAAGEGFMRALEALFEVDGLYVNGKYRWFKSADVMNVLLVLRKRNDTCQNYVNVGVINASIEDLDNSETRQSISRRIIAHDAQAGEYVREDTLSWQTIHGLKSLGLSYYAICQGASFLSDISDCFVRADSLFDITRGAKSGQDSFFYSDGPEFVDKDFRINLLRNMRDITSFELKPNGYAFSCSYSEDYLAANGYTTTLNHIRRTKQINASCRSHHPYWYTLPGNTPLTFATAMNAGSRLFFSGAPKSERFVVNQRVICFRKKDSQLDEELCLALLNSTLGMLLIEASAAPMALGALDTRAETFKQMRILDPSKVGDNARKRILESFEPLKNRQISDALDELSMDDRALFDNAVLSAFDLEQYDSQIRDTLKQMLETRLSAARQ